MNVGQRVMVIAIWHENECVPPPIGSVGEIIVQMDRDGDYEVRVPGWPCYSWDPDWFIPHWALIPIDDGESVKAREREAVY